MAFVGKRHEVARAIRIVGALAVRVLGGGPLGMHKTEAPPSSGALEIVLESDMSIPKDIDHVRLTVRQQGRSLLDVDRDVGPNALLMPASFEVKSSGDDAPATIQAIAYKSGQPRVERDAVTPIPRTHVGELRRPLNYLCVGTAQSDADGGVSSTCPGGRRARRGRA